MTRTLTALGVVERFRKALYDRDTRTARLLLADDLSFEGPAAHVTGAQAYLRATEHAVAAVQRVETRKVFADDADVAVFYDLHLHHPTVASITIADWFHVEGDRIASIRSILDTGPFSAPPEETVVDPVCSMHVAPARAAATRAYAGTAYYFCGAACAEAFDADPARYLRR
jgi:YHS domain-containing protein/limonene-1,2-epoxide hydrolase